MSLPLVINGAVFNYPQNFDEEWGIDATGWAQAVTSGALFLSGGSFPLTAQVDFGPSFGIKVKSISTKTANPATAGYLLLAKTDAIEWRNNANSANLALTIDGSDMLNFNGTPLGLTSLANGDIYVGNVSNVPVAVAMSGDATLTNTGALTIANSAITNAKVSASAAIAVSKIAALTASRAVQTDGSGLLAVSATTSTELGYLSGVTSSIQTQLGTYLPLAGGTMGGAINMASSKITSLGQGTATGQAVAFPVGTAQLAANAVTNIQHTETGSTADHGTVIATQSITTTGGAVLILASASLTIPIAQTASDANVTRGGTSVPGAKQAVGGNGSFQTVTPITITAVDSPGAGTYTYNFTVTNGITATSPYSLVLIEIKA